MSGHMGDISLLVLARLVFWELVQGLVYLEGTHLAGGADL